MDGTIFIATELHRIPPGWYPEKGRGPKGTDQRALFGGPESSENREMLAHEPGIFGYLLVENRGIGKLDRGAPSAYYLPETGRAMSLKN